MRSRHGYRPPILVLLLWALLPTALILALTPQARVAGRHIRRAFVVDLPPPITAWDTEPIRVTS